MTTRGTKAVVQSGTVKFFRSDRGFGFIVREGADDLFFHAKAIADGFAWWNPEAGDHVIFDVGTAPRDGRPRAEKVAPA